jgi:hypothetical protein
MTRTDTLKMFMALDSQYRSELKSRLESIGVKGKVKRGTLNPHKLSLREAYATGYGDGLGQHKSREEELFPLEVV